MTKQLSDCCKAGIRLTGSKNHEDGFACEKCGRIIGTPIPQRCGCACHDTGWNSHRLHAPVMHDTRCCEFMNGELVDEKPMGVSQWKEHGKKYGYWNYFLDEERKRAEDSVKKLGYYLGEGGEQAFWNGTEEKIILIIRNKIK